LPPLSLLLCAKDWIGSQVHIATLMLFALHRGKVP
jgi:hypothetical protein